MSQEAEELEEFIGKPDPVFDENDSVTINFVPRRERLRKVSISDFDVLPAEVNSVGGVPPPITKKNEPGEKIANLWAIFGRTYSPCEKATKQMPSGHYELSVSSERGIFFVEKDVNLDELLVLPDSASEEVIKGIEVFWTKEVHYRKFKFLWKRGILLWGPPGGGKTCTVQLICQKIIDHEGIVLYADNPNLAIKGLEMLRSIEKTRPIVVVLEDIDAIIDNHGEASILALLDGQHQVDNAVFIATTNYPEKLDKRIKNRPSRFDIIKKIHMPSEAARGMYLKAKNDRFEKHPEELETWVKATKDFSIAHLKELIISVECLEIPFEAAIKRLEAMVKIEISSGHGDGSFGFVD